MHTFVKVMLTGPSQEVPMRELLIDAAERAIHYLEGLNERAVVADPTAVARLAELDLPLPDHPSSADETVALLDSYAAATMAIAGPRFFGGNTHQPKKKPIKCCRSDGATGGQRCHAERSEASRGPARETLRCGSG
jgi:hypothetical protein